MTPWAWVNRGPIILVLLKPSVVRNQLGEIINENTPDPKSDQKPKEKKRQERP